MRVEIISTGTELLLGEILNTNFTYLATQLNRRGYDVLYESTVGDNPARLKEILARASDRVDLIITSGGLGPTRGDLTKEAVVELCGLPLHMDEKVLEQINDFFKRRQMTQTHNNEKQALVPEGAFVLRNDVGTAPGLVLEHNGVTFILLPGPPTELQYMCEHQMFPYLERRFGTLGLIKSHTLKVRGAGESAVAEMLDDIITRQSNPTVAIYARHGDILVRVTAKAETDACAEKLIGAQMEQIKKILGVHVYGMDDDTEAQVLGRLLAERHLTIACAESCTGGLATSLLTDVPGSSEYVMGSIISYTNEVKRRTLGVSAKSLEAYGAVSYQVACEMALGVRRVLQTDLGIGITGIAGPSGSEPGKPVGLVYIAVADKDGVVYKRCLWNGSREHNKMRSAVAALGLAYDRVTGIDRSSNTNSLEVTH